jgi:outer membrane immunogenic protein
MSGYDTEKLKDMKRIILIFFAIPVLTFCQKSFSQTFGLKAGFNLSNVTFKSNAADFNVEPGFHAGVTADFPVNRVFSFTTDLLVSTKGYRESAKNQFLDLHEEAFYYYLEVPLKVKAFFSTPNITFSVFAGPYFGYGIYGKDQGRVNSNGDLSVWSTKIHWGSDYPPDEFKRLDYGFVFGPGVQIKQHIEFSFLYELGLANISSVNSLKIYNRVTAISVCYKFLAAEKAIKITALR